MGHSRLDPYKDDIMRMLGEGKTQADIIRQFQERGVEIAPQRLSEFARKHNGATMYPARSGAEPASEREEVLAVQLETTLRFQRDIAETVVNTLGDFIEVVQALKQDGKALPERIVKALPMAATSEEIEEVKAALLATESKMDALLSRTTAPKSFGIRAVLWTGTAWGIISVAVWYLAGWWPR